MIQSLIKDYWKSVVIIILLFLLLKSCQPDPVVAVQKNYYKEFKEQQKQTAKLEKRANELQKELSKVHLPKWRNRTIIRKVPQITNIDDCNDTIVKFVEVMTINEAICDTIIDKMNNVIVVKDSVIVSQKIEVNKLATSHELQKSVIVQQKRKRNFWIFISAILTLGLIAK